MIIMDETENIYEYLKLTPADSNDRVVQELDAQISTWTNQLTRQAARAKAKLDVLKRFKAELAANPNMLKEHADKYASLIKQKRLQQEKAIREDAAIFVVNGQIEESALAEMAKKNPSFTRDEILKILGATIKQKKVFRYKETGSGKEMDSTLFRRIAEELAKVKKRDLYAFLNVPHNAPMQQIRQICDEIYVENQKRPANDEKATVNAIVGHCKTQLLDAGKRADYDYTCGNQSFAPVRSKIERIAAGSDRIIRPEQYKALLEECTESGMHPDKAEYMIYTTAEKLKVTVIEPADSGSLQMCRFCGALNPAGAQVCKQCGLPVTITCPRCGRISSSHDELRCVKCGFVFGDFPRAEALLKDAQTALKYNNVDEAVRCIEAAEGYWPSNPRLQSVVAEVKKAQGRISAALPKVRNLCAQHAYYGASALLGQIGYGSEATALRKEVEGAVANAEALIAKAKGLRDTNEQIECYMQALSICSDCTTAKEKLQLTPPAPPSQICASVSGQAIRVEWSKLPSRYIEYHVVRKVAGRPTGPTDGETVCDTFNNAIDDTRVEPGVSYYYAVYGKCGNVLSRSAAVTTSPAMTVADMTPGAIMLDVQATHIGFGFKLPPRAKSIEVFRDGTLIKTVTGSSFTDTGLAPDKRYLYKLVTVYDDCTGRSHRSAGLTQALCPMSPPQPVELRYSHLGTLARLDWDKPAKGILHIYESDRPFDILENAKVNIDNLKYRKIDTAGNSYSFKKDFSGHRYFLPVTVLGNMGVAGKQVKVLSMVKPSGVRFDRNDTFVMVNWEWNNVKAVRISTQVDGGNVRNYDIAAPAKPQYKVELPAGAKAVSIAVASVVKEGGETLLSEETSKVISLKMVRVDFVEVKSESMLGFIGKDKYSLTVSCDSPLPCQLALLIAENFAPTNVENYRPYLTISPQELKPGIELRKEFRYTRVQKGKAVYFRLIATDADLAKQVMIIPETRQIK